MQHKWSFRFIATSALAASVGMAAAPEVARVEPPSWWAGHTHNPVRLMISGGHLAGARLEAPKDFQAGSSRVNDRGDCLFVDLHIPKNAAPGEIELRLIGGGATNRMPFQLLPAPARTNESRGITTDDVIYLLMPDRFANGDPTNDNPAISPGIHDRKEPHRYHGGDFQGVLDHLDYPRELGVTTLWLTPWYDNLNQPNKLQLTSRDETNLACVKSSSSSGAMEGWLDLVEAFGYMPTNIYLCAAAYRTTDGGPLVGQCPAGSGPNIGPNDFLKLPVPAAGASPGSVTPDPGVPPFVMDGAFDSPNHLLASNGMVLYGAVRGTTLYVATQSPGANGPNDHFIFVTDHLLPAASSVAPWAKSGSNAVTTTKPFLAGESTWGYVSWFVNNTAPDWLKPTADYHGYGVMDFYGTEEHFGDLPRLQKLVERARASGLKVIQDQVVNHTSPFHPWATNPPTPTWFNGNVSNHLNNTYQSWTITVPNPPSDQLKATVDGWFFDCLPDLNQNDPEAATYLIQNSLWWIGMTGVDAVRQDALPHVPRAYWSRWTAALKKQHPQLTVLGEMWDGQPKRVAFFQGGEKRFDGVDSGVDTLFDFPLHYAIRDVFAKGEPMARLTETLAGDTNYVNSSVLVTFVGLHDQPRFLSEDGATVAGLKLAFSFLLTTRGTPLIYSGDEIAMRGKADPDNRRDFPGGWADDVQSAFTAAGRTPEQAEVHSHLAKLLQLRKELAPLRRGNTVQLTASHTSLAFARQTAKECVIVLLNNSPQRQLVEVPVANLPKFARATDRLGSLGPVTVSGDRLSVMMPPRSAAVLVPDYGQTRR